MIQAIPSYLPARLRLVGQALHGGQFISHLAKDLGISRMTLHRWLNNEGDPPTDIDQRLLVVLRKHDDRTRGLRERYTTFVATSRAKQGAA